MHRLYERLNREGRARVLAGLGGALDALASLPWLEGAEGRGRAADALSYLLATARAGIQAAQLPDSGVAAGTYAYPASLRVDRKGRLESVTAGSGGIPDSRQVIAGTGLTGGGALTSDVTLTHATSAATAGAYASPASVTVDARGHITAITAGSSSAFGCWSSPIITIGGGTTVYNIPEGSRPAAGEGIYYAVITTPNGVSATLMSDDDGGGSAVGGPLSLSVPGIAWVIDGTDPVQSGIPKSVLLNGGGLGVQFRLVKIGG